MLLKSYITKCEILGAAYFVIDAKGGDWSGRVDFNSEPTHIYVWTESDLFIKQWTILHEPTSPNMDKLNLTHQ